MSSERAGWLTEYGETELIDGLEPDQLSAIAERPVPPAVMGPRLRLMLWMLRAFTLVVGAMVIYAFVYDTVHPVG